MGVFEKAIIEGDDILYYIPQREPIVMVDKFFGIDSDISCSGLTVLESNIFCKDGFFEDSGIIEHIAQSAALRIGFSFISQDLPVPLGFIGAVNNLTIYRLPKINEELKTFINIEQEVFNITLLKAQVKIGEEIVAECQMKVATSTQDN